MSPDIIFLFSGKRKSGKDYITDNLKKMLGDRCEILKISRPVKSYWAKENNLNLNELMSNGVYKEKYRNAMVIWSDEMRAKDYGCFCREECQNTTPKPIWIVSDIRRKTDVKWFKETYGDKILTIRIEADLSTRQNRGFIFQRGIDDAVTECDLDDYQEWNLIIDNGENGNTLEKQIESIMLMLQNL